MPVPFLDDAPHRAPAAEHDREPDDDEPLRPQWASLAQFSGATGASPDEAENAPANRRAMREPAPRVRDRVAAAARNMTASSANEAEDYDDDYTDDERNPAASIIKMVILVLAAVVIGVLIGLLAFNDSGASGAVALAHQVIAVTSGLLPGSSA